MPTFDVPISEDGTIILFVGVAVPNTDSPDVQPDLHRFRALVDTGATTTAVTQKVVDAVGAVAFAKGRVIVANGEIVLVDRYRMMVAIPITTIQKIDDKNIDKETYFSGGELAVLHLDNEESSGYDVLLGMDLLNKFHITMYGGHFILSN